MILAPHLVDAPRELPPIRRVLETAQAPVDIIFALQRALHRMTDTQRKRVNELVSLNAPLESVRDSIQLVYEEVVDLDITPELRRELLSRDI